ncbi:hypothetical protein N7510_002943 [Penicillium lagena]|uniref:uncharacterized protein n=1 Tax=Penicillium lagena TaxID=94218 RepID=UPI00253FB1DD|nr:uncharacterized protein N7510_002943 [Penicillium lagena]KAJ5618959.1 hypothetical protein N7510_002943 [Penicillium lagena]
MDAKYDDTPKLTLWEKVDLPFARFAILASTLYAALTGVFRDKSYPTKFSHHIIAAAVRKLVNRVSDRQNQYLGRPTSDVYTAFMEGSGQAPETVKLAHGAVGHWVGNKNAKNVLIYYHGGGFVLPANPAHLQFATALIQELNDNGHELAVFFVRYTLSTCQTYPTQLRQAVEALRYLVTETNRSPANVYLGGDSAGANLALSTLLHISHPHPEIDPLALSAPLAGVFGLGAWIDFSSEGPSVTENANKDILTKGALERWAKGYLAGKEPDSWSEPARAPVDWWKDVKTERILILAGSDELLLSSIEEFAKKVKSIFPNTTYVVGYGESHDAPFYTNPGIDDCLKTETGRNVRQWLAAKL